MKVIFLDIDGVLNCKETPNPRKFPYVVESKLQRRLLRLLQRTGADIVLSSTWRYDPIGLLAARHFRIPFIGVTPDLPKKPRRDEITAWLRKHPKVDRYIIIDDEDDELDDLPLFQPSNTTGLTNDIVNGAVSYLHGKTNEDMRRSRVRRLLQNMGTALKGHSG
jgi:hypothetical protein